MAKLVAKDGQINAETRWQQGQMSVKFVRRAISASAMTNSESETQPRTTEQFTAQLWRDQVEWTIDAEFESFVRLQRSEQEFRVTPAQKINWYREYLIDTLLKTPRFKQPELTKVR
jgi:hypothetical protein